MGCFGMVKSSNIVLFLILVIDGDVINALLHIEKAVAVLLLKNLRSLLLKQCEQGGEIATNRGVIAKRATAQQAALVGNIAIRIQLYLLVQRDGLIVVSYGLIALPRFAPDIRLPQDGVRNRLVFSKSSGGALIHEMTDKDSPRDDSSESLSGGVGLPIPQATKAAKKGHGRGDKSES